MPSRLAVFLFRAIVFGFFRKWGEIESLRLSARLWFEEWEERWLVFGGERVAGLGV